MFFILVHVTLFSSRCMLELKFFPASSVVTLWSSTWTSGMLQIFRRATHLCSDMV